MHASNQHTFTFCRQGMFMQMFTECSQTFFNLLFSLRSYLFKAADLQSGLCVCLCVSVDFFIYTRLFAVYRERNCRKVFFSDYKYFGVRNWYF